MSAHPIEPLALCHVPPRVWVLHPGDVVCGPQGDRFETLLGSCVSITLTDPRRTIGAMCHFVHAPPASDAARGSTAHAGQALLALYAQLRAHGINPFMCEAWLHGGGNMFPGLYPRTHVGEQNAQWALQAMAHEGIAVLGHDLGGDAYRRVSWTVGPQPPSVERVLT